MTYGVTALHDRAVVRAVQQMDLGRGATEPVQSFRLTRKTSSFLAKESLRLAALAAVPMAF